MESNFMEIKTLWGGNFLEPIENGTIRLKQVVACKPVLIKLMRLNTSKANQLSTESSIVLIENGAWGIIAIHVIVPSGNL